MSSILSKINVVSKFLRLVYGDYWSKRQGAIIFNTILPFVFWGVIYLWYHSIRNAFITLNVGFLPLKPWRSIVEWPYFIHLIIIVTIVAFFAKLVAVILGIESTRKMLKGLATEAKTLFEVQEKMEDLSKKMRLSLLKTLIKYAMHHMRTYARYLLLIFIPIGIVMVFIHILGAIIHLEISLWIYTDFRDISLWGFVPFSFLENAKEYLVHPFMAIIYVVPTYFLMGVTEVISSNLEKRVKMSTLHGLQVLISATDILGRIAEALSVTFKCIKDDVRCISLGVIILSPLDLQKAIMKNVGRDQKVCTITLNMEILNQLEPEEKKELTEFFAIEFGSKFFGKGRLSKMAKSVWEEQIVQARKKFTRDSVHMVFALMKEGCKFYAIGQKIFRLSIKYYVWCEDPFVKDKIVDLAGK